jgi:hypothetical protein
MPEAQTRYANLRELAQSLPAYRAALADTKPAQVSALQDPSHAWLRAVIEAVYLLASTDGGLDAEGKREVTDELLALSDGRLSISEIDAVLEELGRAVHHRGASKLFHEIASIIQQRPLREEVFLLACAAAVAVQRTVTERTKLAVRALGHAFDFSEGKLQSLLAKARQQL